MQVCGHVYILGIRHSFISLTKIDTHDNLETHYIYKIILVYWYILTMRLSRQNIKFVVLLYQIPTNQTALNTKTILHFDILSIAKKVSSQYCVRSLCFNSFHR